MKQCRQFLTSGLIFSLLAGQAAFADDQPVSAKKPDQANVKQNKSASAKQTMPAASKETADSGRAKARFQVTSSPTGEAHLRNFVGIVTEPVEAALAAQLNDMMKEGQGVSVKLVLPDSPARQSGLKMYDVLTTFNGKAITSSDTLRKFVLDSPRGSKVQLGVIRASKQQTIEVTLTQKLYRNYKFTVKPMGSPPPKKPEDKEDTAPTTNSEQEGPIASRSGEKNTKGRELPLGFSHAPVTTTQNLCLLFVGSVKDGYSVKISYQDETDTLQTHQFKGSIDEITEQTIDMPSHVQMMINERLQELKLALQGKASFRLQVKPYMQGKNRFTRVFLSRTTKDRSVRMVELDHHLGNRPSLNVNQILGNQVFTSELKQLTPAIQEQIRAALHRVRIPTIQIHADNPI